MIWDASSMPAGVFHVVMKVDGDKLQQSIRLMKVNDQ
jgi:hypothetical protein